MGFSKPVLEHFPCFRAPDGSSDPLEALCFYLLVGKYLKNLNCNIITEM